MNTTVQVRRGRKRLVYDLDDLSLVRAMALHLRSFYRFAERDNKRLKVAIWFVEKEKHPP